MHAFADIECPNEQPPAQGPGRFWQRVGLILAISWPGAH